MVVILDLNRMFILHLEDLIDEFPCSIQVPQNRWRTNLPGPVFVLIYSC